MKDRPRTLVSETTMIGTGHGNLYVNVTFDNQRPVEVFIHPRESTRCDHANTEAIGRLASLMLQHGASVEDIVDSLSGGQSCHPHWANGIETHSIPHAVAIVLSKYSDQGEQPR